MGGYKLDDSTMLCDPNQLLGVNSPIYLYFSRFLYVLPGTWSYIPFMFDVFSTLPSSACEKHYVLF